MKKNKKNNKFNNDKYIILLSLILLLVGIFFINYNKNTPIILKEIEDLITFPNRIFSKDVYISFDKELTSNIAKQKDSDLKELKEILNLNIINSNYEFINATIINRDSILWYDNVIIDKGKYSNIKKGMAVITEKGFIGEIDKTTNNTSTIKLITSPTFNSKISVLINKEYGITTRYDINKKVLLIDGISNLSKIKVGDKVLTSGLTSLYPSGILIGEVCGIRKDEFNIEKYVEVKVASNIKTSHYVSVLKK